MKKFLTIFAIAIATISCSKTTIVINSRYVPGYNIPTNQNGEYGIFFGNYTPATKATSSNGHLVGPSECGYDSFNMFAFKDGEPVMNPYLVEWNNSTGNYESTTQELQYFDRNSTEYDFIGVISNNIPTSSNAVVSVDAEAFIDNSGELDTPKELLYSVTNVPKANYNAPVSIDFKHVNAKMYIGFASDRNDTEVIDYAPGQTVTRTHVSNKPRVFGPMYGPTGTSTNITNALTHIAATDIEYVNSQYSFICDGVTYPGNGVGPTNINGSAYEFTGDFDNFNAYEYLIGKDADLDAELQIRFGYPSDPNSMYNRYANYINNSDFRIVHITNDDGNVYIWSVDKNNGSITTETVTVNGINGIRVFAVKNGASELEKENHVTEATAAIENACTLTATASTMEPLTFNVPGVVAEFADKNSVVVDNATFSPSVYYALPVDNPDAGYVVKFSYTYNGKTYYDARVNIPAVDSNFVQGCYYKYVIFITADTNGTENPDDAVNGKDEVDTSNKPVTFNVTISQYINGKEEVYQL